MPALQMVGEVLIVCMAVVLLVSMLRQATHRFHYHFCLLATPICHFLQIKVLSSMVCVSFYFGVGSIFEQYGTVLGSDLQQM
jgi:hypothetical protein